MLRRRLSLHVLLVAVLLSTTAGCSWLRGATGIGDEAEPPPPRIEPETEAAPTDSTGTADELEIDTPDPVAPEVVVPPEDTEVPPVEEPQTDAAPTPEVEIVPVPEDATVESVPDSQHVVDPDPPLRVQISDSERDELLAAIEADLDLARETSALQPDLESLETAERQRWETLAHYVDRTVTFLEADDLRSARDLALKARLLALELRPR